MNTNIIGAALRLIALLGWSKIMAANYYLANSGNDTNSGTSPGFPFRTIQRINQLQLMPGDSVLFERGGTFQGQLELSKSGTAGNPIVFASYGKGSLPVLTGAKRILSWTSRGLVYEAFCPECQDEIKQIYVDNSLHYEARYPDEGYLTMDSVFSNNGFVSEELTEENGFWNDSKVLVRTQAWVIDRFLVQNFTDRKISLYPQAGFHTSYNLQAHHGFFLQGKESMLNLPGEWHYDTASKRIKIYPRNANNLVQRGAEVPVQFYCLNLSFGVSYLIFQDLIFEKSISDLVHFDNNSNIRFSACVFRKSGRDALGGFKNYVDVNSGFIIENNLFEDIANVAINFFKGHSFRVQHNVLKRVGMLPGMGEGYDSGYAGILLPDSSTITHNVLDSIGYIGINFAHYDSVMFNRVSNYGLTKCDVGGIYCWSGSHNYIYRNIVHDGHSNTDGTTSPSGMMCNGIYVDDHSQYCEVIENTCFRNEAGIMVHNAHHISVVGNNLYDNLTTGLQLVEGSPHVGIGTLNHTIIQRNTCMALSPSQACLKISSDNPGIANMGSNFGDNYYCNPYSDQLIMTEYMPQSSSGNYTRKYESMTLAQWQHRYQYDVTSSVDLDYPLKYAEWNSLGSNKIQNETFQTNIGWWWTYGNMNFSLMHNTQENQMTGPCLQGHYSTSAEFGEGNWGYAPVNIQKNKDYLLTYSIRGVKRGGYRILFNQSTEPYTPAVLPFYVYREFNAQPKDDTVFVTGNYNKTASLVFNSTSADGDMFFDNVRLVEVYPDTSVSLPHQKNVLFTNPTSAAVTLTNVIGWRYSDGSTVTQSPVLEAFSSVVLKAAAPLSTDNKPTIKRGMEIQLFPNPTFDSIQIRWDKNDNDSLEIHLVNNNGQLLLNKWIRNEEIVELPASMPSGVYQLQVFTRQGVDTISVVKP